MTPIINIVHFCNVMSIDMTLQKLAIFYNWGSMGKIFIFCRIQLKFCFWLYKKRWHTSWKFQLEITSNKKVIAKKPLTNLYEMNSRLDATIETLVSIIESNLIGQIQPVNS